MEPLDSLYRWGDRVRDRARVTTFFRFLWRRFLDDRLFEAAGALSYTTIFALVPLSLVVFGVLSASPAFAQWSDQLTDYIFSNFVPSSARAVEKYLHVLISDTGKLTAAGSIALVVSLLITLTSVETTFNRIWRVPTARPKFSRFLVYWTVLTLGALVAAASLALSTWFFALAIFETGAGQLLESVMLRLAPVAIELLCFAAIYKVVPHRNVAWRHAIAGGMLGVVVFELVKWGLGLYLANFNSYARIYQKLAFAPIFLLWVYLSWVSVLLGASFAASLSAFRYQPAEMRLPAGYRMYGLLRMLGRFAQARRAGQGLRADRIMQLEPMLTDDMVQQFVAQLDGIDVLSLAESGEWLLSRDLDDVTLAELYEACHLRVPISDTQLPCRDDALGQAVAAEIAALRTPLHALLDRPVSTLYDADTEPATRGPR